MSTATKSDLDGEMLRIYTREKHFEPLERTNTPFLNEIKESQDHILRGKQREFRIISRLGHASGNPAEAGDFTPARARRVIKGIVAEANIDSTIQLSETVMNAGEGEGSFSGDIVHDSIEENSIVMFQYAQTLLACGHGTGRLAVFEATVVASTTAVAALPESVFQLRPGMPVDFVDTDTGGTVQSTANIDSIDYATRTITFDAAISVTAGWGIYKKGSYGNPIPNGVRNIVDDGDYTSTIFGLTRTSDPHALNAHVFDNGQALQSYTEALIRKGLTRAKTASGMCPTVLRCNQGILGEHFLATVPDRAYNVSGTGTPGLAGGFNHETLTFQYGAKKLPFKADEDLPARELYGLYMPGFRKHTLRKAGWLTKDGKMWHLVPSQTAGGTYKYAWVAAQLWQVNLTHARLNSNVKWSYITDREQAGDA